MLNFMFCLENIKLEIILLQGAIKHSLEQKLKKNYILTFS